MSLLETVARRVVPDAQEQARMDALATRLLHAVQQAADAAGIRGTATIQGSVAKGTWLAGSTDVDLFFLVPPGTPQDDLDGLAGKLAQDVLDDPKRKYAQHPYILGGFEGLDVDLVPAYAVAEAGAKMSAVDRTPFHTAWVEAHLDDAAKQDARLAKQWLRGIGAYGAQTQVGGFSGYLVEVMIHMLGGLQGFLAWLQADARPARMALDEDLVTEDAPVVVVDPVDPARNVAAAVAQDTLERAIEAAKAYREAPSLAFFFPAPARQEPDETLHARLEADDAQWLGLQMRARTDRLDIVYPQFQKAARQWSQALGREGFKVQRWQDWTDDEHVCMQWLVQRQSTPRIVTHEGPPADAGPHADRFRAKWQDHPERHGDIRTSERGRLLVEIKPAIQTAMDALRHWAQAHPGGRHVAAALQDARYLNDPTDVLSPWAPHVSDFILDRRPWQR